jgi:hypothetical protein
LHDEFAGKKTIKLAGERHEKNVTRRMGRVNHNGGPDFRGS